MFIRNPKKKDKKKRKNSKGERVEGLVSGPPSDGGSRIKKPQKKDVNYNKLSSTNQILNMLMFYMY